MSMTIKKKILLCFNQKKQIDELQLNNDRKNVYCFATVFWHIKNNMLFAGEIKSMSEKFMIFFNNFTTFFLSLMAIGLLLYTKIFFVETFSVSLYYKCLFLGSILSLLSLYIGLFSLFKYEEDSIVSESYIALMSRETINKSLNNSGKNIMRKTQSRL